MRTELGPALFGRTRRNVLGVLFGRPDEQFHMRELCRLVAVSPGALQRELTRLSAAGIILRSVRGNQVRYRANPECPIYPELLGLVMKTVGVADVLRAELAPLAGQIRIAFVYGSAARGELRQASDIDLLVVGDITLAELVALLGPVQHKLAREVNPTVYPLDEFLRKMAEGHSFVSAVVLEPKIFLVGDQYSLEVLRARV